MESLCLTGVTGAQRENSKRVWQETVQDGWNLHACTRFIGGAPEISRKRRSTMGGISVPCTRYLWALHQTSDKRQSMTSTISVRFKRYLSITPEVFDKRPSTMVEWPGPARETSALYQKTVTKNCASGWGSDIFQIAFPPKTEKFHK